MKGLRFNDQDLRDHDFTGEHFCHAEFLNVSFQDSCLEGACFRGSKLTHVDFTSADLQDVDFSRAILRHVCFREANLRDLKIDEHTVFEDIDLTGVDVFHTPFLDRNKLEGYETNLYQCPALVGVRRRRGRPAHRVMGFSCCARGLVVLAR